MSTIINGRSSLYCHFNKIMKETGISFQSAALSQKHVKNVCHKATVVLRPFGRLLYPFAHSNSGTPKILFKACVCYFFIFSSKDSPSETMKSEKLSLISGYSNFCISVLPSFSPCRPLL